MPRGQLQLTPEQRKIALEKAREARAAKAVLLNRIRKGELSLADVLSDDAREDVRIKKLPVYTLLRALPGVGATKANNVMSQAGVTRNRNVGGLGVRQRETLLTWLAR